MEEREPQPFRSPDSLRVPPGGDITRIERRLQELETENNRPTEYYLLDLQRRFARPDHVQVIEALRTSSDAWQMSPSFWARQYVDGDIIKSQEAGSKEAQQDMVSFSLALLAVSFPYHKQREQYSKAIPFYNEYQQEQVMTHGEPAKGVELSPSLTETLVWLLNQLHIPHDFTNEAMCIPFSLLERQMRRANDAHSRANPITPPESDHEERVATKTLVEEWKRKQKSGE